MSHGLFFFIYFFKLFLWAFYAFLFRYDSREMTGKQRGERDQQRTSRRESNSGRRERICTICRLTNHEAIGADITWTILTMSSLPFWALNIVVPLLSMQGQKALSYFFIKKYLNLCSEDEWMSYGFGTTWGWVINDRIFIFGWTIPLRWQDEHRSHVSNSTVLADCSSNQLQNTCLEVSSNPEDLD